MYYQVTVSQEDLDGKKQKTVALVQDECFTAAVNQVMAVASNVDDIDAIVPLRLAEIINADDFGREGMLPYTATLKAESIDDKGKKKKVTWQMGCAAPSVKDAVTLFNHQLEQGYDNFSVSSVKEQKWNEFFNIK